jgi:hypothetical protein
VSEDKRIRKPKPCHGCGGPKPKVKGLRHCDECRGICQQHGTLGSVNSCGECKAAYMRRYLNDSQRRERNRARVRAYTYGLTIDELYDLESIENCQICGKSATLVIDHDHRTGKIRGMLCRQCNTGIGMAFEDISILASMIQYIERHTY